MFLICIRFVPHFTTLAGTPTATQCPGMGLATTAPAPMVAYSPMVVGGRIDDYELEIMEPSLDSTN